jgi:protein SCO1/2
MTFRPALFAWILCAIAVVAFLALRYPLGGSVKPTMDNAVMETAGTEGITARFTLMDHKGTTVTANSWPSKHLLVYFGFTHCPDVCPLGLNKIAEALGKLDPQAREKIQPVFITVDPERDDVAALAAYVPLFAPDLVGLTGSVEAIEAAKKSFRVYAKREGKGPDYMVNHSAFTYLMRQDGSLAHVFSHDVSADDMAEFLDAYTK